MARENHWNCEARDIYVFLISLNKKKTIPSELVYRPISAILSHRVACYVFELFLKSIIRGRTAFRFGNGSLDSGTILLKTPHVNVGLIKL